MGPGKHVACGVSMVLDPAPDQPVYTLARPEHGLELVEEDHRALALPLEYPLRQVERFG